MVKKRRGPSLDELLARPWCYYCERDFDDLKILTLHQKAKHFKCERCGRRLNTAGGLSVHMSQVHKEQLTEIENALPNRVGLDVEIFGMEGIPDDVLQAHHQRVATQFQQAETERQAATGNPPSGASAGGQPAAKKPKLEASSDLKKRLAEHRARRAEGAAGGSSGDATPVGAGQTPGQTPPVSTPTPTPGAYEQSPTASTPATLPTIPVPAPAQQYSYPQPYGGVLAAAPPPQLPYQQPPNLGYPPFSPATAQPVPGVPAYPPAGYPPQPFPGQPGYGAPSPYTPQQHTPTESITPRSGSLPAPSGLPQRPSFGAPSVNAQQMQQMHMGHLPPHPTAAPGYSNGETAQVPPPATDTQSGAAKEAEKPTDGTEKPSKKEKSKPTRMIYSDETTSPEEKMARLARYAFARERFQAETTLGELQGSAVTGTIRDQDTVVDPAH
ncbi:Zinc finger BED-type predicted [Penicillium angulare]|uniref:Zinc finger BED-type predicted n=1 Tax=Penicillium angulare TaxID=116970 RepID=A0A9W9KHA1_9EURO|nr:Zinc finger BED-type predicted [Penicillium angulare]